MRIAMGDASTVATESYANIRTVRAFSSEWLEEKKYDLNQSIGGNPRHSTRRLVQGCVAHAGAWRCVVQRCAKA